VKRRIVKRRIVNRRISVSHPSRGAGITV
jgi:hypothetical protein